MITSLMLLLAMMCSSSLIALAAPELTQAQQQLLFDRLYQTNLRGPRWTGNENQNTLTDLVSGSMDQAGLTVSTLKYTINRWDPRWWSLSLNLKNGTVLGLPTTGYWPYSGDSGLAGVTAPVHDAGSYGLSSDLSDSDNSTLDFTNLPCGGSVVFFDNPSPTKNYLSPGYHLLGTARNISASSIPELGNLTNPHWQSAKTLDFAALKKIGVSAVIASWVNTSDENGAGQYLPNDGAPNNGLYHVPALYVGNSTGETIRSLVKNGEVDTATVVLNAPSVSASSETIIGHLKGKTEKASTIIIYTHSDGPTIVEENGPILLLAIAEYFARHRLTINLDFVITTGHMSGGHLDESQWMDQKPSIQKNAKAAIVCEHFGAIEWKDDFSSGSPVYKPTGKLEPMWTMANGSKASDLLHQLYLDAFEGTPDTLRMALLSPQKVKGVRSKWYGAGGSSTLGRSSIPTVGIIPQPDYLWAAQTDGGWSKLDLNMVVTQINVILRLISSLDAKFVAGDL